MIDNGASDSLRAAVADTRRRARSWNTPVVLLLLLFGIVGVAPLLAPGNSQTTHDTTITTYQKPSRAHPFGTDAIDEDVLSLVLRGARTSLAIATVAVTVTVVVGTAYGAFAAIAGGWIDTFCMRVVDVGLAVPRLLVLLAVTAFWTSLTFPELALLLGLSGWFDVARLVRAEVSSLLQRDFVLATRAMGVGRIRLATQHILPHLIPLLVVVATLGIGNTVALEAGLMYLGAGVSPSTASLGTVLRSGALHMDNWWLTLFPALALVFIVLACSAAGDAVRNAFAPEQVHA